MGLFDFLKLENNISYSENVKGKWTNTAWSDKKHKEITDKYFPQMHNIEEEWSILYNLKNYSGTRANELEKKCIKNIEMYKKMAEIERLYGENPPPNAPAFKRLAMLYEKQHRYDEAVSVCSDALKSGASGGNMKSRLLRMIKKSGRTPTAEEMELIEKD